MYREVAQIPWDTNLFEQLKARQHLITTQVIKHYLPQLVVQAGPFAGMVYTDEVSWHGTNPLHKTFSPSLLPKILGFYEEELYHVFQNLPAQNYQTILDVGCAEGYFAVGMARLCPQAKVLAFDIDPEAQRIATDLAQKNNVANLTAQGELTPQKLHAILETSGKTFILCDCEGYEKILLDPAIAPLLAKADILVECHDFDDREITPTLVQRFSGTHCIEFIAEQGRNPNRTPFLKRFNAYDKMIAVCEFRPEQMHWLWLQSLT